MSTDTSTDALALELRVATPEDHPSFVRLFAELGAEDPVPGLEEWACREMPNSRFAVSRGQIVGYAWFRTYHHTGHVCHLVTAPAWRGRRVGEWLLRALQPELRGLGCTDWYLTVKRSNHSAIRLYARVGFREVGGSFALRFPWDAVERLGPAEAGVVVGVPRPDEYGAIEAQFGFAAGRMTSLVSDRGDLPILLRSAANPKCILGFGRFKPTFPGMIPCCALRPSLARNLLEVARPHRRPGDDDALVVVENNADLARHFLDAGGRLRFELLRLAAPLSA